MAATLGLAALLAVVLMLGLVLALVALPVHVAMSAEVGENTGVTVEVRPFGGIGPRLRIPAGRGAAEHPRSKRTHSTARKRRWRLPRRLVRRLPGLALKMLRQIRIDRVALDLTFGTGDPADTGILFGQLAPLVHAVPGARGVVALRPDFDHEKFHLRADVALHVTPLTLIWPVLRELAFAARPSWA